jgi:hypothetical protein
MVPIPPNDQPAAGGRDGSFSSHRLTTVVVGEWFLFIMQTNQQLGKRWFLFPPSDQLAVNGWFYSKIPIDQIPAGNSPAFTL